MKKTALIFGITGQDGAYLTKFLLNKGYIVHGVMRRASQINTQRIDCFYEGPHAEDRKLILHYGDLTDFSSTLNIIKKSKPDEIYNLAAQSHVGVSFELPEYTANVDAIGALRILEAMRTLDIIEKTKFLQASTSEMYGKVHAVPQDEETPFHPRSPYGVAKVYAYWIVRNYRESYNAFATNCIGFNHESPLRGPTFVTRKITRGLARIKLGDQDCLYLGNLDSERDWSHASDFVRGMWQMLQHDRADDFVLASGKKYSVREFLLRAFAQVDIELKFEGEGEQEIGVCSKSGETLVKIDPRYYRPAEVDLLLGDSSKARKELNWEPNHNLDEIIKEMVLCDLYRVAQRLNQEGIMPSDKSIEELAHGKDDSESSKKLEILQSKFLKAA